VKIQNYFFKVFIKGLEEPLLLDRIETKRLKQMLERYPKGFVKLKIKRLRVQDGKEIEVKEEYWLNPKEIVAIIPEEDWNQTTEFIEIGEEEEKLFRESKFPMLKKQ